MKVEVEVAKGRAWDCELVVCVLVVLMRVVLSAIDGLGVRTFIVRTGRDEDLGHSRNGDLTCTAGVLRYSNVRAERWVCTVH